MAAAPHFAARNDDMIVSSGYNIAGPKVEAVPPGHPAVIECGVTGVYFIMITLAFGLMLFQFAISWPACGSEDGLAIHLLNGFPGLNTLDPIQFLAVTYALLLIVLLLVHRLTRPAFGLAPGSARQNEERVEVISQGHNRLYLTAFTISDAITGLAGALFADLGVDSG
ncbi:MAG: hypothetical protein GY717_19625 [Rhodobacteraceae bacterium]|nr:hypothetical protein [Paracoccaceae bacterium]